MITDTKKLRLIKQITEIEDQELIDQLESVINASSQTGDLLASIASPIKKVFDLEKVKAEQNFPGQTHQNGRKLFQAYRVTFYQTV